MEKIQQKDDVLKVLMSAYEREKNRYVVLLLASSVTPLFTRKYLWTELIEPLKIFTNQKAMDTYFDAFLKYKPKKYNGAVTIVKSEKTTKFYTLNADGYRMVSDSDYGPYLVLIQLLVDSSSEEVETRLIQAKEVNEETKELTRQLFKGKEPEESKSKQQGFQERIGSTCDDLKYFLLKKNEQYGSSTLDPLNVFKQLSRSAKVESRIEDKLARLKNIKKDEEPEAFLDTIWDLAGYLVLYIIILEEESE
jgi:hypothetical protein